MFNHPLESKGEGGGVWEVRVLLDFIGGGYELEGGRLTGIKMGVLKDNGVSWWVEPETELCRSVRLMRGLLNAIQQDGGANTPLLPPVIPPPAPPVTETNEIVSLEMGVKIKSQHSAPRTPTYHEPQTTPPPHTLLTPTPTHQTPTSHKPQTPPPHQPPTTQTPTSHLPAPPPNPPTHKRVHDRVKERDRKRESREVIEGRGRAKRDVSYKKQHSSERDCVFYELVKVCSLSTLPDLLSLDSVQHHTSCRYSYCMGCIKGCWDQDDHTGVYSCPQCRETFTPRPVLRRNTMLAEVVEKLKMIGLQAAPPAHCYTGPGDVTCDVCTGRKHKAIKSCLVCLASYCETHLKLHNELHPGNTHNLINATGNLQEKICSHHEKALEIYCRTDQQCICYLCTIEDHRGHDTVSTITARTEIQKQLGVTQRGFQNKIQEREKELQDLRQAVQSLTVGTDQRRRQQLSAGRAISGLTSEEPSVGSLSSPVGLNPTQPHCGEQARSAQAAVEDSERIFTELIHSIERRRSEVKELIRDQEKAAVSEAEGLLERLEQEIAELKRRDAELEQLSHTEDHIHFLQHCKSQCVSPGHGDSPSITVHPHFSFEAVKKSVSELKQQLEDVCKGEMAKISRAGLLPEEAEAQIVSEEISGEPGSPLSRVSPTTQNSGRPATGRDDME
ncbi:hypothetical protein JZ751_023713 [Albula glossodonta]|uniref:B box-type domain-containing protein n=1 Tax=Albula glossodonta TaxID=121402 RepID=A0A8T2MR58_9TELE|nr:hypothetical protein JZ751_023713 [Albula glossodonta]